MISWQADDLFKYESACLTADLIRHCEVCLDKANAKRSGHHRRRTSCFVLVYDFVYFDCHVSRHEIFTPSSGNSSLKSERKMYISHLQSLIISRDYEQVVPIRYDVFVKISNKIGKVTLVFSKLPIFIPS